MTFLANLRERRLQPEIMDRPDLEPGRHQHALRGLERINRLSGSARSYWRPLAQLALAHPNRPLRVLDLACGGGDVLCALARRARRTGLPLTLSGCDLSSTALDHARQKARAQQTAIEFFLLDALTQALPTDYDVLLNSLFLHHLTEDQALAFLAALGRAARKMVLLNDLVRGRRGWLLAWLGTRLLTRSEVVHHDGLRSVEGAFTLAELREMAERGGLPGATVTPRWPCRMLLTWKRTEANR